METIIGIDLGTTNSAVSVIRDGRPIMLKDANGQSILPSVVGLDNDGQLLVGTILIVGLLTFFPALSLAPVVEHFIMVHSGSLF